MIELYKKQHKSSFSLGVFPTIELLKYKPTAVLKVYLSTKGSKNRGIDKIVDLCKRHKIPYEFSDNTVNKLSPKENTHAVGIFNKYDSPVKAGENHVVLVNPQDMGNIGTLIRTMLAFDILNLAIISPGVDVFHPKAVRSAMGAVFQINFSYFPSLLDYKQSFANKLYFFTKAGSTLAEKANYVSPFALVFGNEAAGFSHDQTNLGETVKLRQSAKVDSLNISITAGIAMYEATKTILAKS